MRIEKQIAKELRMKKLQSDLKGEGQYVFENTLPSDLMLPRPTKSGRRDVKKGEQFIGDNYYFSMLGKGLKLIREIQSPVNERLITEQPPIVTSEGVVEPPQKKMNEHEGFDQKDVLLTETPVGEIKIFRM